MNDKKIRKLAVHGVFTAIIAMLTLFASVPLPVSSGGAYLNAGDAAVFLSAYVFGPVGGAVVSSVGSAIADLLHGAPIYIPATFVIKGLMALIAGILYKKLRCGALPIAGVIMPLGYFAFEYLLYGSGAALFGLWTNAIQYAFGVLAGILLILALKRSHTIRGYWERKEQEFDSRIDTGIKNTMVKAGKSMINAGLTKGTGGNISVFDRERDRVYITPHDMPYDSIKPEDIPVYSLDGAPLETPREPSMELQMHLNIYRARDDVSAIVHTHSPALIKLAEKDENPLKLPAAPVYPVGSEELAKGCVEHLKQAPAVLLRSHGAVVVGKTCYGALSLAASLEKRAGQIVPLQQ